MRRWRKGSFEDETASVDLTPLIDVVFVVLIMFIVVVPMLELDQVILAQGKGGAQEVKSSSPIAIHVHADNQITFQGKPIALETLPELMEQAYMQHPNQAPQLFHDRRAPFGTYQAIKNAVELAGFTQLDLVLDPQ